MYVRFINFGAKHHVEERSSLFLHCMTVEQEKERKRKEARLDEMRLLVKANPNNKVLHQQLLIELQEMTHPGLSVEESKAKKKQYGNVQWTESALQKIKEYGKIIEVGAGLGQWQKALTDIG